MVRWQPPPADDQNGEITGYKIRYRKGARKSEATEVVAGAQLHKLLDSKLLVFSVHFIYRKPFWNKWTVLLSSKTLLLLSWDPKLHDVHRCSFTPTGLSCKKSTLLIFLFFFPSMTWLVFSYYFEFLSTIYGDSYKKYLSMKKGTIVCVAIWSDTGCEFFWIFD